MKEKLQKHFDALNERERMILLVLTVVGALFIYSIVWFSYSSSFDSEVESIKQQQKMMQKIIGIKNIYRRAQKKNSSMSDRIGKNQTNINSYISRTQESMNIEISTIKELKPSKKGDLVIERIEMSLRRIDLPTLLSFMYAIENKLSLVYVEAVDIKRRYDKKSYDAKIVVATLKEKEEE
ncbi:type II secretion system protein M [bacterium]|nr:type II secretion system protein M [bacterium]